MVAFFSSPGRDSTTIETQRLSLCTPTMTHFEAWADLRQKSRSFLEPWEPTWPAGDLTRHAYRQRIRRYQKGERDNSGFAFMIIRRKTGELVGGITVSRVLRGVAQSCSIGYWVGLPHTNKGFMSEAVSGLLPEIFEEQGFHRLEAACLPTNRPSIRLLEKVGFQREGYAREYLKIAGKWQDHLLFAMLESDFQRIKSGPNG
ncbi:MAG: GNAT family protein [Pseudomonadota bacterium]